LAKLLESRWAIDDTLRRDAQSFALALVDALNFSAKIEGDSEKKSEFYRTKAEAVAVAIELGCEAGIGQDHEGEEVLYLFAQNIGVVSVHTASLDSVPVSKRWPHSWCAIRRQRWAFAALEHASIRQLLATYTSPGAHSQDDAEFVRKATELVPHYTYGNYEH
jgi:hypothetical protein